jgi:hypothetical protein
MAVSWVSMTAARKALPLAGRSGVLTAVQKAQYWAVPKVLYSVASWVATTVVAWAYNSVGW